MSFNLWKTTDPRDVLPESVELTLKEVFDAVLEFADVAEFRLTATTFNELGLDELKRMRSWRIMSRVDPAIAAAIHQSRRRFVKRTSA
jgi:hypothetical protein